MDDQEPSCSVDHEQRALRSPLQPLTRRPSCPWTQTGVSAPASTKVEMSALPLETHRPFGAGDASRFAGQAARGTREEGRRADRLRWQPWLGRSAHHPFRTARPQTSGRSSRRASTPQAFRPTPTSRALSFRGKRHAQSRSPALIARRQRRCWRRPLSSPTGSRACPMAQRSAMKLYASAARSCSLSAPS